MLPTIATGNVGSATATTGYEVANSLRFNSGSSDALTQTPSSSGNRKTFTISLWTKPSSVSQQQMFLSADDNQFGFESNGVIFFYENNGGTEKPYIRWEPNHRDPSAWYHICLAVDTTQSTDTNRVKLYVNGTQITSYASTPTHPDQNQDLTWNTNVAHAIGRYSSSGGHYDGYMAEYVLIDGTALDPTSFGEFDSDTNIWKPIDVSGLTFGTNGFYLDFENSGSLGADVSGNGNNFTVNNLTSIDQTTDTCTNNFCTLNPLVTATSVTDNQNYSEGNTIIIPNSTDNYGTTFSTMGVQGSGKWYWEAQIVWNGTSNNANFPRTIGFVTEDYAFNYSYLGQDQESWGMLFSDDSPDQWFASHPDENNNEGGTMANGDTVNLALDLDNGYFYFGVNGTYINSGDPTSGATGTGAVFTLTATDLSKFIIPAVTNATNTTYYKFNFGNPAYSISSGNSDGNGYGLFEYQPPSGYLALCTKNLATDG